MDIEKLRNIGISAHIDSGKTTLTERILYYCNKIYKIGEVKGKDGSGATMDFMELEKERGITISSAATNVRWKDHYLNIIDTPGHVDFTIEVENALRVLDGAVLVLCGVAGVQSQSITVDRQLKRYKVPHLAFVNKLDRVGADPFKVTDQLINKLGHNAVLMQIPIGKGKDFEGIIDLISMKARYFKGEKGEIVEEDEIPLNLLELAKSKREEMIDAASMFSDELAEAFLEGEETEKQIIDAVRIGTIERELTPVYIGSAYKNIGVQLLLDAIINFLPNPAEIKNYAHDKDNNMQDVLLETNPDKPTVALAFKLENQKYGQLTYIRIYQGKIKKGEDLYNARTGKRFKVGRLAKMHAQKMEDINVAYAGDIVAIFGVDCALGDTFVSKEINYTMRSGYIPEPILSLAIETKDNKVSSNLAKALARFTKEDPTFKAKFDEETGEIIISGMGELQLSVYMERIRREYNVHFETGVPKVAFRETITKKVDFDYTHKKQSGGHGQYAKVTGYIKPNHKSENEFVDEIKGGNIPSVYIPGCKSGFESVVEKGLLTEFPIVGVKLVLTDGNYHPVDSSVMAFEIAIKNAFKEIYHKAQPKILEPMMKVSIETPSEFRGNVIGGINQRRGIVLSTEVEENFTRIDAQIPLMETFGYATALRSITQGKAEFTMEFAKYEILPTTLQEKIIKKALKE